MGSFGRIRSPSVVDRGLFEAEINIDYLKRLAYDDFVCTETEMRKRRDSK